MGTNSSRQEATAHLLRQEVTVCDELLSGHGEATEVLESRVDLGAVLLVTIDERLGRRHVTTQLVRRDDRRHLL